MMRRERRTFIAEFKQQMVNPYIAGKPRTDILKVYNLSSSIFNRWVKQAQTTGSFKHKDNFIP